MYSFAAHRIDQAVLDESALVHTIRGELNRYLRRIIPKTGAVRPMFQRIVVHELDLNDNIVDADVFFQLVQRHGVPPAQVRVFVRHGRLFLPEYFVGQNGARYAFTREGFKRYYSDTVSVYDIPEAITYKDPVSFYGNPWYENRESPSRKRVELESGYWSTPGGASMWEQTNLPSWDQPYMWEGTLG